MKTANEVPIERRQPLPAGSSVESLINIGIQDESVAPTVLEAVMAELGSQKQYVYPP
jgi:small subunit ribosomal protein S29